MCYEGSHYGVEIIKQFESLINTISIMCLTCPCRSSRTYTPLYTMQYLFPMEVVLKPYIPRLVAVPSASTLCNQTWSMYLSTFSKFLQG